jgi:hypothetical protein
MVKVVKKVNSDEYFDTEGVFCNYKHVCFLEYLIIPEHDYV